MATVDVKKKPEAAAAPAQVQPAAGPQADALKDVLKDPLAGQPPAAKAKPAEALTANKQDKDKPAEASIIPAKEPGEKIVVVKQAEQAVVVAVKPGGAAEVVSESAPGAVKPEKVEKAVQQAVEPSPTTQAAAAEPANKDKGVAAKIPV